MPTHAPLPFLLLSLIQGYTQEGAATHVTLRHVNGSSFSLLKSVVCCAQYVHGQLFGLSPKVTTLPYQQPCLSVVANSMSAGSINLSLSVCIV